MWKVQTAFSAKIGERLCYGDSGIVSINGFPGFVGSHRRIKSLSVHASDVLKRFRVEEQADPDVRVARATLQLMYRPVLSTCLMPSYWSLIFLLDKSSNGHAVDKAPPNKPCLNSSSLVRRYRAMIVRARGRARLTVSLFPSNPMVSYG